MAGTERVKRAAFLPQMDADPTFGVLYDLEHNVVGLVMKSLPRLPVAM